MKKSISEYKDKSVKELEKQEILLREEIGKIAQEFRVSPPKDTNIVFKKRKKLAVLLTVLSEKRELEKLKSEVKS